jgi:hypothetical protein
MVDLPQHSSVRHDVDYVTDLDGLQRQAPRSRTARLLAHAQHGVGELRTGALKKPVRDTTTQSLI